MEKKKNQNRKKTVDNFIKYSNIAFQMGFIIFAGVFGGIQLDKLIALDFPVFTLILTLISVGGAIYVSIKDFLHNNKKSKKDNESGTS